MKRLLDKIMYDKNLSIRQVSIMTGVPKSTINDIAVGKTMPRIDTIETIAKVSKFAFPTFMNLITNKCPSSRTIPQNRVRFPLVMCIYSKGAR